MYGFLKLDWRSDSYKDMGYPCMNSSNLTILGTLYQSSSLANFDTLEAFWATIVA